MRYYKICIKQWSDGHQPYPGECPERFLFTYQSASMTKEYFQIPRRKANLFPILTGAVPRDSKVIKQDTNISHI